MPDGRTHRTVARSLDVWLQLGTSKYTPLDKYNERGEHLKCPQKNDIYPLKDFFYDVDKFEMFVYRRLCFAQKGSKFLLCTGLSMDLQ